MTEFNETDFSVYIEEAFRIASGMIKTPPTLNHIVALAECANMLSHQCTTLRLQLQEIHSLEEEERVLH